MTSEQIQTLQKQAADYGARLSESPEPHANICAALWSLSVLFGEVAYQFAITRERQERADRERAVFGGRE